MNNQNIVTITRLDFDIIKSLNFDDLIKYLINNYPSNIKTAIVEGFVFKIED